MADFFSVLAPTEEMVLTFEFGESLSDVETLTGVISTVVTVELGTVVNPNEIIDIVEINGNNVHIAVKNLTDNVNYRIAVTCSTSNLDKVLTVAGILPVRSA